jgi:glycosyltransferase involved in cell wall biosynthesis
MFRVEAALRRTCVSLLEQQDPIEIICLLDGPAWTTVPGIQRFLSQTDAQRIETREIVDHPGRLFNIGLEYVQSDYVTMLWPGTEYRTELYQRGCEILARQDEAGLAYTRVRRQMAPSFPQGVRLDHGHLQQADLISAYGAVYRTSTLKRLGGFDPDPVFQRYPGWELMLRVSRTEEIGAGAALVEAAEDNCTAGHEGMHWEWDRFPFVRTLPYSRDEVHRAILRPHRYGGGRGEVPQARPAAETAPSGPWSAGSAADPIRVTVTGGCWEPVHNQLCFFNYFECKDGEKLFDWKTLYDADTSIHDVEDSDIVIISRGRCSNVAGLARDCRQRGIPTLYMLDDNWLTVGRDWPEYHDLFSPGKADYEAFLDAARACTAGLVYNDIIYEYLKKYISKLYLIDVNIYIDDIRPPAARGDDRFVIGYAGSIRYTTAAFQAARRFVEDNPRASFLLFSHHVPAALEELLRRGQLRLEPPTGYRRYRAKIGELRPDVMIAPLDISETAKSKCINKFLENTAAGAVGIYSGIPPYTAVVRHGENGILVPEAENDRPEAWYHAYERLFREPAWRRQMLESAWELVASRYETRRVFPQFLAVIADIIAGHGPRAASPPDRRTPPLPGIGRARVETRRREEERSRCRGS